MIAADKLSIVTVATLFPPLDQTFLCVFPEAFIIFFFRLAPLLDSFASSSGTATKVVLKVEEGVNHVLDEAADTTKHTIERGSHNPLRKEFLSLDDLNFFRHLESLSFETLAHQEAEEGRCFLQATKKANERKKKRNTKSDNSAEVM